MIRNGYQLETTQMPLTAVLGNRKGSEAMKEKRVKKLERKAGKREKKARKAAKNSEKTAKKAEKAVKKAGKARAKTPD